MSAALVTVLLALTVASWLGCTNDAFDPASVDNAAPTVRFFIAPPESGGDLNATSYNNRTFHWSGTDRDGFVTEYYVSIRLQADVPAPWDTTTATDTTMTFTTDDEGNAEATFYLVCRDDRGALSDTLVRYVPLRNFPPALHFQSDFDPLVNMQREIHYDGSTPTDTTYWNWGVMNARLFVFDLDGNDTLEPYYWYTLGSPDPDSVRSEGAPGADPEHYWIQAPFSGVGDVYEFEIDVRDASPGDRTLTVAVRDEAAAETRLTYSWQVRAPRGDVLLVPDNYGSQITTLYRPFLDDYLGVDGYDRYDFWKGFPDRAWVLLESLRKFDVVVWLGGGSTSQIAIRAAAAGGVLQQYVQPNDDSVPGRLVMVSRALTGNSGDLPAPFLQTVLGIKSTGDPLTDLAPGNSAVGKQALGQAAWLPPMTLAGTTGRGVGLDLLAGTEAIYQFEECIRCYSTRPRWDPIIVARRPLRDLQMYASTVSVSFQLETMDHDEALAALAALFANELGVTQP